VGLAAALSEDEPAPQVAVDPDEIFFGQVCRGAEGSAAVTVRNLGPGELELQSLRVRGAGFSLADPPALPAIVAAGAALEIGVHFSPTGRRLRPFDGTLHIGTNDPKQRRVEIGLSGLVEHPVLVADPRFLDLGEAEAGPGCEMVQQVSLINRGRCAGDIQSFRVRGTGARAVSVRGLTPGPMGPGEARAVEVVFSCERPAETEALLSFIDESGRAQAAVSLIGIAY
jgi:hypothetical protein